MVIYCGCRHPNQAFQSPAVPESPILRETFHFTYVLRTCGSCFGRLHCIVPDQNKTNRTVPAPWYVPQLRSCACYFQLGQPPFFLLHSTMLLSKSSLLSKSRLFISRFRRPRIHVCGLLGTYDIEDFPTATDDYWMAIDFVAIRELIGACDDMSIWLCGTPIRRGRRFLLGDPDCDRIAFNPPPFETLLSAEPNGLAIEFLIEVTKKSERLSAGETLVIVLVGHGEDDRSFTVGGDGRQNCKIRKEQLEKSVGHAKGNILVIITTCHSGGWTSPHWTRLAATGPDEEAPSIVVSGSGECRGGFFTNALLAEHASEFSIRPPCPGIMDNRGFRHPQKDHDFGPEKIIHPIALQPQCSLQEVMN